MKAAVLYGPLDLRIEEVPEPQARDGEAVVQVKSVGICGTDVLVYQGLHKTSLPIIPGHEFAGIVAEVRGDQWGYKAGDKVFARGSWGCGACNWCCAGSPALCHSRRMLGISVNGCMGEYVKLPVSALFPLPDLVNFEEAQALVTIACAINLAHSLKSKLGMNVVIFGSGHSGLLIMQVLKLAGADQIVMVGGRRESRLQLALQLGADLAVFHNDPELSQKIRRLMPQGPDVAVESSGSGEALNQAVRLVGSGGTVLAYSIYNKLLDGFEVKELYNKGLSIIGVKGAGNYYQDAARLLEKRRLQIKPIISHIIPLADTLKGFELMADQPANVQRIVINP